MRFKTFQAFAFAFVAIALINNEVLAFQWASRTNYRASGVRRMHSTQMIGDFATHIDSIQAFHQSMDMMPQWAQYAAQGIADAAPAATAAPVCPAFGQPGWAPFCFLNGNPVFNAFDAFQMSIQNSIVALHDFLAVSFINSFLPRCRTGCHVT